MRIWSKKTVKNSLQSLAVLAGAAAVWALAAPSATPPFFFQHADELRGGVQEDCPGAARITATFNGGSINGGTILLSTSAGLSCNDTLYAKCGVGPTCSGTSTHAAALVASGTWPPTGAIADNGTSCSSCCPLYNIAPSTCWVSGVPIIPTSECVYDGYDCP